MNEETLQFLLDYDYSEIEKIPGHIQEISETQKLILEEMTKESPVIEEELLEAAELEEVETFVEVEAEGELLLEEEPTDYLQLIYEELQKDNLESAENQLAIIEHLEFIQESQSISNEVEGMAGLYMMYLIPLAVVVSLLFKVLNPFIRV